MRRPVNRQADFVAFGGRMLEALAANSDSLSHLEGLRSKLEAAHNQMVELLTQQDALTASKQTVTKQIQTVHASGVRLILILRRSLQEHYGSRSEKLAEFGVQPFRGRPRRIEGTVPPSPPEPPTIE
ncbi:MAG TPA: hypothetical protein VHN15_07755 [Thermoanaerobaculia bacterium]|nr:hypothetical protein [Thermoanaerobaculia bacterium]